LNPAVKNILLWVTLVLILVLLWHFIQESNQPYQELPYSEFIDRLQSGEISKVTISGQEIEGKFSEVEQYFRTVGPAQGEELQKLLEEKGVLVDYKIAEQNSWWISFLFYGAPMIILIAIWFFFIRQMQTGGNKALSFGKSKAKLLSDTHKRVTFKDVAGVDEAEDELQEIIEFLKEPQKFQKLGGRIPKGVLLMGPPGTGKTLLARAIAGEANVPFFSISGSDFVEMFVGVGASRVRDLFEQGKKNAPCIIFIDEIDAVGRHRGAGLGGGHDEREQTLNQLLVEMDGFESNDGVILISATNRPDVLDPALLRPGRFDRRIVVDRPDINGREGILKVHTRNIPLNEDVELLILARGTPGFSGADLESLVNEAALNAARYDKKDVCMEDFENAKDKVLMGLERRSLIISDEEKRNTAFHEAGHALVAVLHEHTDPIHKVTIIPRGRALGLTQQLPLDDKHNYTKDYLEGQICVLLGGKVSEEMYLDRMTTGAGNDLERITDLARKMVCEWGMSDKLGPLTFGKQQEQIFLGREFAQHQDYSEATAELIDGEVKAVVEKNYQLAKKYLTENSDKLNKIAEMLLEREVLDAEEINAIMAGTPLKSPTAGRRRDERKKPSSQGEEKKKAESEAIEEKESPALGTT